ncbi:uncharacterized protein LOC124957100 [Vespa velutina]|uniref:uncharacterized protein LOC124957100 n=1 Tax=Vespa velutina TaxID=202808 RepID=UPI001FB36682|nr:uncharacterized protein LOC124957100 [Vespa velutina]
MEDSGQANTMNETSPTIDVNNKKDKTENDESLVSKITTDLCELKQINCEIGAKEMSQNCSTNSCNEEDKVNNKNCSNPLNEFREEQKNDQQNVAKEGDEKNYNECCALEDNSQKLKQCCQSPSRGKETTSMKQKRKSRSTRRRLNAMINNTSLHFSDTDSEGELVIMEAYARTSSPAKSRGPIISVTMEDIKDGYDIMEDMNPRCLTISSTPEINISRRGSFAENLTDVDEIYTSEPENEQKLEGRKSLTLTGVTYQGETDVEDISNDEDEPIIYVTPRLDILCEFGGETITTKEGDGPFSVEIRSRMSKEIEDTEVRNSSETVIMPNTDSEDMEISDEDDLQVASCSHRDLFEDFDVLAGSQIVMTNVNKMDNTLAVQDIQEDVNIGDCYTDVEDVD